MRYIISIIIVSLVILQFSLAAYADDAPATPAQQDAVGDAVTEVPPVEKQETKTEVKKPHIETVSDFIITVIVAILIYAILLAVGHFVGTFASPEIGLVISGGVVLWVLFLSGTYLYEGFYADAAACLLALAVAAYFHFTKVMAVA